MVKDFQNGGKIVDFTRELGMSVNSVDVEANFAKRPSGKIVLDDEISRSALPRVWRS